MQPVDKKDLIILSELLKNSRKSYSDLAEIVKLSVPAVKSRIEKLVKNGIIEDFTLELNYALLTEGKQNILLVKAPYKNLQDIAAVLYEHKYVKDVLFMTGNYNLLVSTNFITDKQKADFIAWFNETIEVDDLEIFFVYDELKDKKDFTIEKPIDIKLICDYCKREFSGDIFSKVIGGKKRYFCCNTCLTQFEKNFQES
jgi:DNA-binding Lrp family transcriptional regulator